MRRDLPTGTVTFIFTDIEGSTKLLRDLGEDAYATALAEHRHIVRGACTTEGGVEVDTQGDAFFFAFPTAPGALAASVSFNEGLAPGPIRVRTCATRCIATDHVLARDVVRRILAREILARRVVARRVVRPGHRVAVSLSGTMFCASVIEYV